MDQLLRGLGGGCRLVQESVGLIRNAEGGDGGGDGDVGEEEYSYLPAWHLEDSALVRAHGFA